MLAGKTYFVKVFCVLNAFHCSNSGVIIPLPEFSIDLTLAESSAKVHIALL